MKTAILLANGFEEIEALTPLDVLRRAGAEVDTIGIGAKTIVGAHNISVIADKTDSEADATEYDCVIFPGGMPGATNLDSAEFTDKIIAAVLENGGRFAAICAAPLVLGKRGLLKGKQATCYPGFEDNLIGATISPLHVVTDGNVTTASGMGVALDFSLELVSLLFSPFESMLIKSTLFDSPRVENAHPISYDFDLSAMQKIPSNDDDAPIFEDEKFLKAVEVAIKYGYARTGLLQRHLNIGYGRAAKYMDIMQELGIIGEKQGAKPHDVLITKDEWLERLERIKAADDE